MLLKKGHILLFNGEVSEIPDGWKLCDGEDNRPDMTNYFIPGIGHNIPPAFLLAYIIKTTDN